MKMATKRCGGIQVKQEELPNPPPVTNELDGKEEGQEAQVKQQEFSNSASITNELGMLKTLRDLSPAHYEFKIESYSSLLKREEAKIESGAFEAEGFKWRLVLYANGNKEKNGNGHISLYLAIVETDTLQSGWEVNINFKLFVYDQRRNKYLTIQDANGAVFRFHKMKTEWGFAQLLPLDVFNNASNGYLVNDYCVFGAEIFLIKGTGKRDCLSTVKEPAPYTHTWKIVNFSTLSEETYASDVFTVGRRKWRLRLYPKGAASYKDKSISGTLQLMGFEEAKPYKRVYVEFKLRIKNEVESKRQVKTVEHGLSYCFDASKRVCGVLDLISLKDLENGFLMNDTLIFEVEISLISIVENIM